jgi:SAM-dependent methyltransferase
MTVQQEAGQAAAIDEAKVEAFMGKVIGDYSGAMMTIYCALGDRLGLFKKLAEGPATSGELAKRAGVNERYTLEWLRGMAAAGYIERDRSADSYSLPPEHALALAQEGSPMFMGGGFQMVPAMADVFDDVADRFRAGGGVSQEAYPSYFWEGLERFTSGWFENFLLQEWIPSMPAVKAKLEQGCRYADVGTGAGLAVLKLADAFPNSEFVGYDISEAQIERARKNVEAAGLSDRVRIELKDVAKGLDEQFDVISTYDVIHDAVDPLGLLTAIRKGLEDDGIYICLDINCADDPADNEGPLAAMFYGFSMFYCMTTSLAHDGEGLGTCGLPAAKLRELCEKAGFSEVRRVEMDNPFNNLYEVKA